MKFLIETGKLNTQIRNNVKAERPYYLSGEYVNKAVNAEATAERIAVNAAVKPIMGTSWYRSFKTEEARNKAVIKFTKSLIEAGLNVTVQGK